MDVAKTIEKNSKLDSRSIPWDNLVTDLPPWESIGSKMNAIATLHEANKIIQDFGFMEYVFLFLLFMTEFFLAVYVSLNIFQ